MGGAGGGRLVHGLDSDALEFVVLQRIAALAVETEILPCRLAAFRLFDNHFSHPRKLTEEGRHASVQVDQQVSAGVASAQTERDRRAGVGFLQVVGQKALALEAPEPGIERLALGLVAAVQVDAIAQAPGFLDVAL